MDRKVKVLILFLIIFAGVSIAAKYYKFVIDRDYYVFAAIDCDTESESCFVWDCDLEEDEECDHTPYKYIYEFAGNTSYCNPYLSDECEELSCTESELDNESCEIIFCSDEELAEDEYCYE